MDRVHVHVCLELCMSPCWSTEWWEILRVRSAIARLSAFTSKPGNSSSCFFCTILLRHNWCWCVRLCVCGCACMCILSEERTSCTKWLEALTDIFMNLVVLEEVFCRPARERCQEFHAYFSIYLAAAPGAGLTAPFIDKMLLQHNISGDSVLKWSADWPTWPTNHVYFWPYYF